MIRKLILSGWDAIQVYERATDRTGMRLDKYADPAEGERLDITLSEALEIAREDAALLRLTIEYEPIREFSAADYIEEEWGGDYASTAATAVHGVAEPDMIELRKRFAANAYAAGAMLINECIRRMGNR